jgi:HSP20 family protein
MFSRFFGRHERWIPSLLREEEHFPAIDYVRKDDRLVVRAELPGIDPKDLDIAVTGNQLRIRGERKAEKNVHEEDYFMREISCGEFERVMTLPEGVNTEQIEATFKNGILEITVPAKEVPKSKPIEIKTEEEKK